MGAILVAVGGNDGSRGLSAWLAALVALGAGLPVGLVAVAWIGLDGWGYYRDGEHLGRLLSEAWVTMAVLAIGSVVLGALLGRHGWLAGLLAWPVAAIGLPSLLGASGAGAATSALLVTAGSIVVAALGGIAGARARARAWLPTSVALAAVVVAIAVLHAAGAGLTGPAGA
jgi:hypothetical protein